MQGIHPKRNYGRVGRVTELDRSGDPSVTWKEGDKSEEYGHHLAKVTQEEYEHTQASSIYTFQRMGLFISLW